MDSDYEQMRAERDRLKMQLWESERLAAALEQERNQLKELRLVEAEQREKIQDQRDRLKVELQESEQLRKEAFAACETMRQELAAVTLERDGWKAGAEAGQEQATQLRQQVEALEASVDQEQGRSNRLQRWAADLQAQLDAAKHERDALQAKLEESERLRTAVTLERNHWIAGADHAQENVRELQQQVAELQESVAQEKRDTQAWRQSAETWQEQLTDLQAQLDAAKNEASKSGWVVVGSHLPNREQLDAEIVRLTNNWGREIDERKALQQQVAELQAQLEAAAVTPQQQPDGTAERLEAVRRMIGHVLGWYTCTDWFDEVERAEAWEQVGALLGHLQREAG